MVALQECLINFNPDYIIHLAARTDLNGKSLADYAANTIGVDNILKAIGQLSDLKKIIIASSMLVCGLGYTPENDHDYHPTTIYGQSKVITEQRVWNNQPKCDWAIIRPTSIWGPWFAEPYRDFFDLVLSRRYFHIGKVSCTKTYGYVGNTVYQIEKLLTANTFDVNEKIYYLGDIPPTNIEEWANEIAKVLNYKIVTIPYAIIFMAAICGDILKRVGVKFPMTTFRLHNMTTDNTIDLSNIALIASDLPFSRIQGITDTLKWLKGKNLKEKGT
jgi:nucleoside-diphosphate-sugar epimerase